MTWWDRPLVHVLGVTITLVSCLTLVLACAIVLLAAWCARRATEGRLVDHAHLTELQKFVLARFTFFGILVFGLLFVFRMYGFPVTKPAFKLGAITFSVLTAAVFTAYVVLVVIGANVVNAFISRRALAHSPLNPGLRYAVGRLTQYVVLIIGLSLAVQAVGVNLSSLTVVLGALSVGFAFGTQNIVNNFVSGLIILIERPISVGDWIEVGSSAGRVQAIGGRSTSIVTSDNVTLIVPNGQFINETIVNWSYGDPRARIRIPIGVAYASDLEKVREVLLEVGHSHSQVLAIPEPTVFLRDFGASSINLELAVWTDTAASRLTKFRSELNFAIASAFAEHGIEIPFPQRVVTLAKDASAPEGAPAERIMGSAETGADSPG